jgi:flagellar basal-body rod protein FlgF
MQSGLYVALSAQMALEKRLTTLADNVANAGTVGFRATNIKFKDMVTGLGDKAVEFTAPGGSYLSNATGGMKSTGNPFDFAIQGDAWFAIQTPAGTVLTRDGRFTMLDTGQLVTLEGHPLLDAGGAEIQLNAQEGPPSAGRDGALVQNGNFVAAIGLYQYAPGDFVERWGNSGIVPDGQPQPLVDDASVGVLQGYVEESNVNPVQEMTRLIMVQRAFENAAALIRETESSFSDAIKTLGSRS